MDAEENENKEITNKDVKSSNSNVVAKPEMSESCSITETSQISAEQEVSAVAVETSLMSGNNKSSGQEERAIAMDVDIDKQKGATESKENISHTEGSSEPLLEKDNSYSEEDISVKPQLSYKDIEQMECESDSTVKLEKVSKSKTEGDLSAVPLNIKKCSTSAMDIIKEYEDVVEQEVVLESHDKINLPDNITLNPELAETKSPEPDSIGESVSAEIPTLVDKTESEFTLSGTNNSSVLSSSDIVSEDVEEELIKRTDVNPCDSSETQSVVASDSVISSSNDTVMKESYISTAQLECVVTSASAVSSFSQNTNESLMKNSNVLSAQPDCSVSSGSAITSFPKEVNESLMKDSNVLSAQPDCSVSSGSAITSFPKEVRESLMKDSNILPAQPDCAVSSGSGITSFPKEVNESLMKNTNVLPAQPDCAVSSGSAITSFPKEVNESLPAQAECTVTSGSSVASFPETTKESLTTEPDCTVSLGLANTSFSENTNESLKKGINVISSSDDSVMKESEAELAQPDCTVSSGSADTSFPEDTNEPLVSESDLTTVGTLGQESVTVSDSGIVLSSEDDREDDTVKTLASSSVDLSETGITSSAEDVKVEHELSTPETVPESMEISNSEILPSEEDNLTAAEKVASESFDPSQSRILPSENSDLNKMDTFEMESADVSDSGLLVSKDGNLATEKISADVSDSEVLSSGDKGESNLTTTNTLEADSTDIEMSDSGIVSSGDSQKEEEDHSTAKTLKTDLVDVSDVTTAETSVEGHKSESKISTVKTFETESGDISDLTTEKTSIEDQSISSTTETLKVKSAETSEEDHKSKSDVSMSETLESELTLEGQKSVDISDLTTVERSTESYKGQNDPSAAEILETKSAVLSDSGIMSSLESKLSLDGHKSVDMSDLTTVERSTESYKGQNDPSAAEILETKSAVLSDSGIVSSLEGQRDETTPSSVELLKPKSSSTLDSGFASGAADKEESLNEKNEHIQDESLKSESPQNTGGSTKVNETETDKEKQINLDSEVSKTLPAPELNISTEINKTEVIPESKAENVTMSDSMSINVTNLKDDDDSKSNLMKTESSDGEHLESTPTNLETNVSETLATESVAKEETFLVQSEEKKNSAPDPDKGDTSVSVETSEVSKNVTEQKPADTRDRDGDKTSVKDIDEDSGQVTSLSSSAISEDNDTRSSDTKMHGVASLRDEDSRASFVSAVNETEVDLDMAADESNPVPLADDDVEMSDFNEDSNASKSIDLQPKQETGNDKIFLAADESNPVPLHDEDVEMSDFNEDSNASKSIGPQPKQINGNGKLFSLSDEASMSSVVSADSVDSENIPLARMVEDSDNFPLSSLVPYSDSMPATPASVDTASDAGPTPAKRSRHDSTNATEDELNGFPAENLFEYQWPQDGGEWYMLQEQLSEFLGIKSFKRKYPDLYRRTADKMEKDFIRERGVVTETQSDLGLTALRSEEVYDLMLKDYPDKYQEYASVLHEREKKTIREQHKEYGVPKLDKGKMADYIKKAVRSAAEFNSHFQRERKEERRSYFDLQTFMIHYPSTQFKKLAPAVTKPGPYPVSLIPGQFQNFYKSYTPDELKYLPLNTIMFDPPNNRGAKLAKPSSGESSSEVEDNTEDKAESGSEDESDGDDSSESGNSSSDDEDQEEKEEKPEPAKVEICRICKEAVLPGVRKNSQPEDILIKCSECGATGHPSCLDLPKKMVAVIKTYPWQCMECKTCVECMDPYDEDKMMFCDRCDRGYHTFCVGLKAIPTGRWECRSCKGTSDNLKSRRSRH